MYRMIEPSQNTKLFRHPKQKNPSSAWVLISIWWCGPGSNRRHKDFQSFALPTELPHHPDSFSERIANIGFKNHLGKS